MAQDLGPVRARLEWADRHLDAFDGRIAGLLGGDYGVRRELEADGAEHVYYAVVRERLREDLSLMASDVLHHLRSCLDNLVYRLAELNMQRAGRTLTSNVAENLAFPICTSSSAFKQANRRGRLDRLTPEAVALVRGQQPYMQSNPPDADPLWDLHEVQNVDKHRFLLKFRVEPDYFTHAPPRGHDVKLIPGQAVLSREGLTDGAELARLLVDPPADIDLEFDPHPLVVLDEPRSLEGREARSQLHLVRGKVEAIIYTAEQLP